MRFAGVLYLMVVSLAISAGTTASACGSQSIARPGKVIDDTVKTSPPNSYDAAAVTTLRQQIKTLVAAGKDEDARVAEEQAMALLGYRKLWLRCGPGSFSWVKLPDVAKKPAT
jgi:hypothetical protein